MKTLSRKQQLSRSEWNQQVEEQIKLYCADSRARADVVRALSLNFDNYITGHPQTIILCERAGWKCEYCGLDLLASAENFKLCQRDHLVPLSKGGPNTLENLRLSCKHCNADWKGKFDPRDVVGHDATCEEWFLATKKHIADKKAAFEQETLKAYREAVGWHGTSH
jgi:5-methylcytosine-specific restriction endonuclease McrA